MAGDGGRIASAGCERSAVQAAAGDFYLLNAAILADIDFLRTALSGKLCSVGLTMIENIIISADFRDAAVIIAQRIHRMFTVVQADVSVRDDGAAIDKTCIRPVADRIAQLMALVAGIDKIILPANFPDRGGLEEAVALKAGSRRVMSARNQYAGLLLRRHHILFQLHYHGVLAEFPLGHMA